MRFAYITPDKVLDVKSYKQGRVFPIVYSVINYLTGFISDSVLPKTCKRRFLSQYSGSVQPSNHYSVQSINFATHEYIGYWQFDNGSKHAVLGTEVMFRCCSHFKTENIFQTLWENWIGKLFPRAQKNCNILKITHILIAASVLTLKVRVK